LLTTLNLWLGKRFELVNGAQVASFLEGHALRLTGHDPEIRTPVALSNTGYGVSQVLPLIALLALSRPGIVLVEQPELHLHPRAQVELADLLLEFARQGHQLLVETHSEHLLLRLRARFARKQARLQPEDVRIFFVDKDKEGSKATRVELGDTGRLENWPAGFFGASAGDLADLLRSGAYE
jgi:predicted ATPase